MSRYKRQATAKVAPAKTTTIWQRLIQQPFCYALIAAVSEATHCQSRRMKFKAQAPSPSCWPLFQWQVYQSATLQLVQHAAAFTHSFASGVLQSLMVLDCSGAWSGMKIRSQSSRHRWDYHSTCLSDDPLKLSATTAIARTTEWASDSLKAPSTQAVST